MHFSFGLISFLVLFSTGTAISCFRCNSTQTLDCLEKFLNPNPLRPESCSDVFEARYCIKTTGIYNGELGTQRFCSPKELGDYCEYVRHYDGREYRGCVYTCYTDGCNSAHSMFKMSTLTNLITIFTTLLAIFKVSR
ncbi:UPAR/Ly6 domain-containing protein bou [Parasteatoda tepidariorum]|uniref:UPAR/Ly6 domain-containing protein bou n=1 Tax=Parasteatoda tepidariorum TaxID=114398 RepID=UPI00077FCAEA|nr:U-scoloptoxin(05)-Sm1a [Parasteatoda tepidariorum]